MDMYMGATQKKGGGDARTLKGEFGRLTPLSVTAIE